MEICATSFPYQTLCIKVVALTSLPIAPAITYQNCAKYVLRKYQDIVTMWELAISIIGYPMAELETLLGRRQADIYYDMSSSAKASRASAYLQ